LYYATSWFFQDLHQGDDLVTVFMQKSKGMFDELVTAD
jgi:hypothetical protein